MLALETREGVHFGRTEVINDYVLFEFESVSGDEVDVQVTFTFDGQNSGDPVKMSWNQGETGKKCVEFSDFGGYAKDQIAGIADYSVMLLHLAADNGWSVVWMTIYSG
jgi:hypothetical protein